LAPDQPASESSLDLRGETPPGGEDRPAKRRWALAIILAALLAAAGIIWTLTLPAVVPELSTHVWPKVTLPPKPSPTASAKPPQPTGITEVAHLPGQIDIYAGPGGAVDRNIEGTWWGYPGIVPVIDRQGDFLHIRLPMRPNETTGWVREDEVELSTTPYRIEVSVGEWRLRLFEANQLVLEVPVAVGGPATPTPLGHFYLTMLAPGPNASYGPQVLALSAHSETINDWQGSGDAITAIHGPVGAEAQIGTTGGAFTNGCIRLHMADLEQLYVVLPGSPVDIIL